MRWRQVIVLWLVAAALGAQYLLVDRRRPTVHPTERPARRRLMDGLAPAQVTGVRLERGAASVALRRYGEDWAVEQPAGGRVPGGLVQAFVEAVTAVEEIDRVGGEAGRAAGMEFGPEALRLHVTDAQGHELRLTIGGANAAGTAVYARVGDAADVVLIGRNLEYYARLILEEVHRSAEPAGDGPVA